MKYLGIFLLSLNLLCPPALAAKTQELSRVQKIQNRLAESLPERQFDIQKNSSQNTIEILLAPELGHDYKNQLHLWLLEASRFDKDFNDIHLKWSNEKLSSASGRNLITISIIIFLLLGFLYFCLNFLSSKKKRARQSVAPVLSDEDYIVQKVEKKLTEKFKV